MNYDHTFHAGNFADVIKHACLCLTLCTLLEKEKGFVVIDTHAGQGRFDLQSSASERTSEAKDGIVRLMNAEDIPDCLQPYTQAVRSLGWANGSLRAYPGSPWLTQHFLRPQDRLVLAEKHQVYQRSLKALMGKRPNTRIEATDGYALLKSLLPPPERRGLVLIDPPFELKTEFATLGRSIRHAVQRWESGRFLIWFPVKDREIVDNFLNNVAQWIQRPTLVARLWVKAPEQAGPLTETGLLAINPTHPFETALPEMMPYLARTLAQGEGANWSLTSLGTTG